MTFTIQDICGTLVYSIWGLSALAIAYSFYRMGYLQGEHDAGQRFFKRIHELEKKLRATRKRSKR